MRHCKSAQLETAPTKQGERRCLFIFMIHYKSDEDFQTRSIEDLDKRMKDLDKRVDTLNSKIDVNRLTREMKDLEEAITDSERTIRNK